MKIIHVINSLAAGGAEKLVTELSSAQAREQEVSLFTFHSDNDIFQHKLDKKVHFFPTYNRGFFNLKTIRSLAKLIKENDVVHVHLFPAFYIVAFLSIFYPKRVYILTEHNTFNKRRKPVFWLIEKIVYSRYSKVICISEGVHAELNKWMGKSLKKVIINNFVDLNQIRHTSPANKETLNLTGSKLLIMVGSFSEQKDQKTVIEALSLLDKSFKLLLIGDGPKRNALEQFTVNEGLNERVVFLGIQQNVTEILKICDYGILSSNWEGFGIVALEYMASGIVALGTNVSGLNEVIPNKSNLFATGDHEALAARINTIEANQVLKQTIIKEQEDHILDFDIKESVQNHLKAYSN